MRQTRRSRGRSIDLMSRRNLLLAGACGGWAFSHGMTSDAFAAPELPLDPPKSMILLWLWGGPSHLDTFDMKPLAPTEYRGPFAPIDTTVPGLQVCELFPRLAKLAHRCTILRSLNHESNDHGLSGTIGLTGSIAGAISLGGVVSPGRLQPAQGAVIAKFRPPSPTGLPTFITLGASLHQGKRSIAGEGAGPLGAQFDPFRADYVPGAGVRLPQLQLRDDLNAGHLGRRLSLMQQLDQETPLLRNSRDAVRLEQFYQQAAGLLTSPKAREVFDLEQESPASRALYGKFRFGQNCLLARRLVEIGIPFVQVNWSSHVESIEDSGDGGWDLHDRNFVQMQDRHAWMLDQALSALLTDLDQRGLLDSTLIVAVGEFGRGPRINPKAGRDHWNHCYSALLAGGGLPGGFVLGSSDRYGEYPKSHPCHPADLIATLWSRQGISGSMLTELGLSTGAHLIPELL